MSTKETQQKLQIIQYDTFAGKDSALKRAKYWGEHSQTIPGWDKIARIAYRAIENKKYTIALDNFLVDVSNNLFKKTGKTFVGQK